MSISHDSVFPTGFLNNDNDKNNDSDSDSNSDNDSDSDSDPVTQFDRCSSFFGSSFARRNVKYFTILYN